MSNSPLDLSALDQLRQLAPDGSLLSQVLTEYRATSADTLDEIATAVERACPETVRTRAHYLKSSSASIGAQRVCALCRDLEQTEGTEGLSRAVVLVAELREELASVIEAIHAELGPGLE